MQQHNAIRYWEYTLPAHNQRHWFLEFLYKAPCLKDCRHAWLYVHMGQLLQCLSPTIIVPGGFRRTPVYIGELLMGPLTAEAYVSEGKSLKMKKGSPPSQLLSHLPSLSPPAFPFQFAHSICSPVLGRIWCICCRHTKMNRITCWEQLEKLEGLLDIMGTTKAAWVFWA